MLKLTRRQLTLGAAFGALVSVAPRAFAADPADIIYSGGTILTMDDAAPHAEAVAVKGGRIIAAGSVADVMKLKGDNTKLVDLGGRTMLPGFVDGHGHVTIGGLQALSASLLPPPDGGLPASPTCRRSFRNMLRPMPTSSRTPRSSWASAMTMRS